MATPYLTYEQVSQPGYKGQFTYKPPTPQIDPNAIAQSAKSVPELNQAFRQAGIPTIKNGQINPVWQQRFQQLQSKGPQLPSNFSILGNSAKNLAGVIGGGLVNSEKTVATGIARVLPGGTADINAQTNQANSATKNIQYIKGLQTTGKISPASASRIIQANAQGATQAEQQQSQTIKAMPTKGQLAAGFGGTAADIATAGTLPEIKGATTTAKVARGATQAGAFGLAGGLNAASVGGTKKQIAENTLAGAAFPLGLKAIGKGAEVAQTALGKNKAVSDLIRNTKAQNLTEALNRANQSVPTPRSAFDNHIPAANAGAVEDVTGQTKPSSPAPTEVTPPTEVGAKPGAIGEVGKGIPKQSNLDVSGETKTLVQGAQTPYTAETEKLLRNTKVTNGYAPGTESASAISRMFSPGGGAEGKSIANDLRANLGHQAVTKNSETLAAKDDIDTFKKMNTGDHLTFIQKMDTGMKQASPELDKQAAKIRTAQNQDFELARSLKPNLTYVENYFPRAGFWDNSKGQVDAALKKWGNPSLAGSPAALEHRAFPTIYDGIKLGLTPKESNPAIIALNSRLQLLRAKSAQQFMEEQIAKGRDPDMVRQYVDRVMSRGMSDNPIYKDFRSAGFALNNVQLGLSGFHVAGTGLNAVVSQFSNGLQSILHGNLIKGAIGIAKSPFAPAEYIFKGSKIIKDYKGGNVTKAINDIAEGGGRIGAQADYRTSGLAKSLEQFKTGNASQIAKGTAALPFRAFSTAAKPIMEWWVPRIKAGATQELINRKVAELGANATPEAVRAAKSAAVDSIDNRFGQLVQDNLMWNKTLKDGMSVLMRSPGWNIGTVREIGGGATTDLGKTLKGVATGKGLNVSERTTYTASLAATTMLIGTALNYMFTGKGPTSLLDYFYPKTGETDKNGNPERVSLPTYAKDVFAFSHNPVQTVKNKASPALSIGLNLASNKDYFGNEIRNPKDSVGTQAKQTGSFIAKNVLPFTVTNANQRVNKGKGAKIQSFFGMTPAPGYITKSKFSQAVDNALNQATGTKSLTPEQQAVVDAKSQAKVAAQGGDMSKINALVKSGQITQKQADNLKTASTQTSLANQFQYLIKVDKPTAVALLKNATPDDVKQLGDLSKLIAAQQKTAQSTRASAAHKAEAQKLASALTQAQNKATRR